MNVVILLTDGYPNKFSANNSKAEFIMRGLKLHGDKVTIVDRLYGNASTDKVIKGVSDCGIDYIQMPQKGNIYLSALKNLSRLHKILKELKSDDGNVLIISEIFLPLYILQFFVAKMLRYKRFYIYQEWSVSTPHSNKLALIEDFISTYTKGYFVNGMLPISHFLQKKGLRFNKPQCILPIMADYNREVSNHGELTHFTFCANVSYLLRNQLIIDAFREVSKANDKFKLVLVLSGSSSDMETIEHQLKQNNDNNIVIETKVPQKHLFDIYDSSVALIVPLDPQSIADEARFSQKIAEYASSKRPIITSRVGEIPYYFKSGESIVTADYSIKGYANAMRSMIDNPQLATTIGQKGYEVGVENFSIEVVGKQTHNFLRQIFNHAPSPIKPNNMKKISVITLQNVRNYGSVLQALATQEVFEKIGCKVDFYNYFKPTSASIHLRLKRWTKGFNPIKKAIYYAILLPSCIKEEMVFPKFLKKYVNVQKEKVCTEEDFRKLPLVSDVYCTGSDQTWNSTWNDGVLPELFLSFVPDNKKKIAYAASFGKKRLDKDEIERTKKLISRYHAISVRESSAVDIIKGLGFNAQLVLDPTLQVSRDFWISKFNIKVNKEKSPYVLIYQLNTNKKFDAYAKEFAKRKGMRLVRFCIRHYQMFRDGTPKIVPEVKEFVNLIANASYVITDSFHATAFSINLNTEMICIYPSEFGGRIESILNLTSLQSRHLTSYDDFSFVDANKIDFAPVNKILEKERAKGYEFLTNALNDGKDN